MKTRFTKAWRKRWSSTEENRGYKDWLLNKGSLTARLQRLGPFSVQLISQRVGKPNPDEIQNIGTNPSRSALIREVALICDERPLVFAHTVMQRRPRGPMSVWLKRLGNKPFGELLFAHPGFLRGPIETQRIDARNPLFHPALIAFGLCNSRRKPFWARRSCFYFRNQSAWVTEIFSPEVIRYNKTIKNSKNSYILLSTR